MSGLEKIGIRMSRGDMHRLIYKFDKDGDGMISYREFVAIAVSTIG